MTGSLIFEVHCLLAFFSFCRTPVFPVLGRLPPSSKRLRLGPSQKTKEHLPTPRALPQSHLRRPLCHKKQQGWEVGTLEPFLSPPPGRRQGPCEPFLSPWHQETRCFARMMVLPRDGVGPSRPDTVQLPCTWPPRVLRDTHSQHRAQSREVTGGTWTQRHRALSATSLTLPPVQVADRAKWSLSLTTLQACATLMVLDLEGVGYLCGFRCLVEGCSFGGEGGKRIA